MHILRKLNISELSFTKILSIPTVFFHWVLFTVPILVVEVEYLSV